MAEACRNLAPVLGAGRAAGRGRGGAGGSRLTFADVTAGGQAYEMPDSAGGEPARAVGARAAGKPPVRGHADVWGGAAHDTASLQGVQRQLQTCARTVCNQRHCENRVSGELIAAS